MKILTVLTYYRPHTSGLTIYAERLARASVEQLSAWALNFVDAHSLDEVFRTP